MGEKTETSRGYSGCLEKLMQMKPKQELQCSWNNMIVSALLNLTWAMSCEQSRTPDLSMEGLPRAAQFSPSTACHLWVEIELPPARNTVPMLSTHMRPHGRSTVFLVVSHHACSLHIPASQAHANFRGKFINMSIWFQLTSTKVPNNKQP